MIQDDYLHRLIRQIAQLAAAVAGRRAEARAESVAEIDEAYGDLFGLPRGLLDRLDARTVRQLVREDQVPVLLELLEADAALAEATGDAARAAHRREIVAGLRS